MRCIRRCIARLRNWKNFDLNTEALEFLVPLKKENSTLIPKKCNNILIKIIIKKTKKKMVGNYLRLGRILDTHDSWRNYVTVLCNNKVLKCVLLSVCQSVDQSPLCASRWENGYDDSDPDEF